MLGKGSDGGKPRTVPVHPELRPAHQARLAQERSSWPEAADTPALVLNRCGGRLSDHSVREIIGRQKRPASTPCPSWPTGSGVLDLW
jgi:hypothetical protein